MKAEKTLDVVVPCYREEAVLPETARRLKEKLTALMQAGKISRHSRILFVNDGSKDRTWEIIEELHRGDRLFSGVNLSRNRGHQNALLAGLMTAVQRADMMVSMDADLQDDINAIDKMLELHSQGCEIVYGVRNDRSSDSWFKRVTARMFYNFMKATQAKIIPNHSDYRLMSRRAVEMLLAYEERNLFLRGIVPLIGLKSERVYYSRTPRHAGYTKYPLGKMLSFAIEGITSFSVRPIRAIFTVGLAFMFIALSILVYVIVVIIQGRNIPGWASIMLSIWFIGSLILIALGIIGEYVSKIYLESKHRPRYFIDRTTDTDKH